MNAIIQCGCNWGVESTHMTLSGERMRDCCAQLNHSPHVSAALWDQFEQMKCEFNCNRCAYSWPEWNDPIRWLRALVLF